MSCEILPSQQPFVVGFIFSGMLALLAGVLGHWHHADAHCSLPSADCQCNGPIDAGIVMVFSLLEMDWE